MWVLVGLIVVLAVIVLWLVAEVRRVDRDNDELVRLLERSERSLMAALAGWDDAARAIEEREQ